MATRSVAPPAPPVADAGQIQALFKLMNSIGESGALRRSAETDAATRLVSLLSLPSHHDPQKNWDTLKCLYFILGLGDRTSPVLDAGASRNSVILSWLYRLGFPELYACDLRDKQVNYEGSPIRFSVQDMSRTNYPAGFFQAVTSISVIEHGVELDAYLREMSRVLRPGGLLLTSTDYWSEPIDCRGIFPYGSLLPEMKVFQPQELEQYCRLAETHGFSLCGLLDLRTEDRVIYWERVDRRYTFAFIALRKNGRA